MNKTFLITGASGFLGSHLCDLFISKSYRVIDWKPIAPMEEDLERTFKYFKSILRR